MDDVIISALGIICMAAFYLLPCIIGIKKNHNAGAIFALNLLLGWTVIGWIVALIWAMTDDPKTVVIKQSPKADDNIDKIQRLKNLLDSEAITKEEYESEKHKILNQ